MNRDEFIQLLRHFENVCSAALAPPSAAIASISSTITPVSFGTLDVARTNAQQSSRNDPIRSASRKPRPNSGLAPLSDGDPEWGNRVKDLGHSIFQLRNKCEVLKGAVTKPEILQVFEFYETAQALGLRAHAPGPMACVDNLMLAANKQMARLSGYLVP
ncbi:MAG: hypothetical protein ACRDFS_08475 [Chloroflexota bacterium]